MIYLLGMPTSVVVRHLAVQIIFVTGNVTSPAFGTNVDLVLSCCCCRAWSARSSAPARTRMRASSCAG